MSVKHFYATMLSILATVVALSLAWEFGLEDSVLPLFSSHHEPETWGSRWEFVFTAGFFSFLALLGPTVLGVRMIRRDQALHQTIVRLSQQDYLTGLYNRRRITELLDSEIQRATRYGTKFATILIDVDHFKAVNDRLGHQAGDQVLIKIAEVIRSSVRAADMLGRWGGEEFLIICPETDIGGGFSLAEKIRARLESTDLGKVDRRTASFGVTAFGAGDDLENIMARVDVGLYTAKQKGRNRVEKAAAN